MQQHADCAGSYFFFGCFDGLDRRDMRWGHASRVISNPWLPQNALNSSLGRLIAFMCGGEAPQQQ
jgi:hypothetical protein